MRRHILPAFALLPLLLAGQANLAAAAPDCRCRFFGQYYGLGDTVCMRTSKGMVVARCTLNQNVTSWQPTKRGCLPVSGLSPDRRIPDNAVPRRTNLVPARYAH